MEFIPLQALAIFTLYQQRRHKTLYYNGLPVYRLTSLVVYEPD